MAAATASLHIPRNTRPWIIDRNNDLLYFFGGALLGYLVIALMAMGAPIWPFYFVMLVFLEGPHVFATATRTYFDRTERRELGWALWMLLPFSLVGPAMFAVGLGAVFTMLAFTWLHLHIAKQHLGFVMIYKRKGRERDDFKLDRAFILASLALPLAGYWIETTLADSARVAGIRKIALAAYGVLLAVYVGRQARKAWRGESLNRPKLLLLALVVPLQWLAFAYAPRSGYGIIAAGVPISLGHTLQYHRLMWFHNRNRYGVGGVRAGLASIVNRKLIYYVLAVVGLNLALHVLPRQAALDSPMALSAFWGLSFTHFFLDGRIWRIRKNPELAAALRM